MLRERLLTLESDLTVVPSPYAISIKEFKALIEHQGKEAPLYLSYVFFMKDPRSKYAGYDEEQRRIMVSEALFGKRVREDRILQKAMEEYARNMSPAAQLLEAAVESVAKLKDWLAAVDITSDNYDPLKHVRILSDMGKTVSGLKDLERAVESESDVNTTYGGVVVSRYNE
jgi:hypothetical protein